MKKKLTIFAPYIMILGIDFYLLPFLANDTGTAMLFMLCIMPAAALVSGVIYGMRNGFHIILSAAALLLFVPTIFIHYNPSAWIYAPVYSIIVLAGTGIGRAFYQKK
ncbi:MAG: hypothetical protein HFG41_12020 [Coprococcus sp.]|nr:hypothetical protein [Coprococcus sp.]